MTAPDREAPGPTWDVVVVGGGLGGIYAVKTFRDLGLSVLGLESAPQLGGVWYHNDYPGARVDVESLYYCYFFDPELFRTWRWTEKFAAQSEVLAYLHHVIDRYHLRPHFQTSTKVVHAGWNDGDSTWEISTQDGRTFSSRFLVMASGQFSTPKTPDIAGLDQFRGQQLVTSQWNGAKTPHGRVAVLGTGASGVQVATALAGVAQHLFILQRTPSWTIPAYNRLLAEDDFRSIDERVTETYEALVHTATGSSLDREPLGKIDDFSDDERERIMQERWDDNPIAILFAFSDSTTNPEATAQIEKFVRTKVHELVHDREVADALLDVPYPFGTRRIVREMGYFTALNRPDVSLVDVRKDPIVRMTEVGFELRSGRTIEVDTVIFATGFDTFYGALRGADIRNADGVSILEAWASGPRTYLGSMTTGFPNLFLVTGPGSPSILTNMNVHNVQHVDFIAGLVGYTLAEGGVRVEPEVSAQSSWTARVAEAAADSAREADTGFMVHVNADGSHVVIPYAGGLDSFAQECAKVAESGYPGFTVRTAGPQP